MIRTADIIIRRLELQDVKCVESMVRDYNLGYWTSEDLEKEIIRKDSLAFVAKTEKEIAGFIIARLIMSVTSNHSLPETKQENSHLENEIEIYNIVVTKNQQRKRIGNLLIEELLKSIDKIYQTTVWLEVRESNIPAINFYKSNGFTFCYKRKNFYNNPVEDAIVMKLEVKS